MATLSTLSIHGLEKWVEKSPLELKLSLCINEVRDEDRSQSQFQEVFGRQ